MYPTLCDDSHGNPFAVDHLLAGDEMGASVNVGPDTRRLGELPGLALYAAWQFGHAARRLGPEVDESELLNLMREFELLIGHSVSG